MGAYDTVWDSTQLHQMITAGDVGGAIRLARHARGWTQARLGEAANCSASTISRLESQRAGSGIDVKILLRACQAVGMPEHLLQIALSGYGAGSAAGVRTARAVPDRRRWHQVSAEPR